MEKGKKEGSKAKNRRNEKKVQKKSVLLENIEQNENILEQSEHTNENSVTQNNTRTSVIILNLRTKY